MLIATDQIVIGERNRRRTDEGIRELTQSIQSVGQMHPIWIDAENGLISGERRLRACELLGRDVWAEVVTSFSDGCHRLRMERDENTCRVPFTPAEMFAMGAKLEALEKPKAAERKADHGGTAPGKTANTSGNFPEVSKGETRDKVAAALGVSGRTYDKIKTVVEAAAKPDATPEIIEAAKKMEETGKVDPAYRVAVHVAHNSGENEWYTPPEFLEAARSTMGAIDLDPASCELANKAVQAKRFFTAEDDGLAQTWSGRVWLNPPYAQPAMGKFAEAVSAKYESGEIVAACILVNNATETAWFQRMLGQANAVCFPKTRVRFLDPQGKPGAPLQGQAVIYFGANVKQFLKSFEKFGTVLVHA